MINYASLQIALIVPASGFVLTHTENDDGSYRADVGNTAQSVLSLLSKSSGWTADSPADSSADAPTSRQYSVPPSSSLPDGNPDGSYGGLRLSPSGLLRPHVEILSLIEGFLKLKGEVASRIHAVVADNYDLIRSITNILIGKISTLHSFSLTGIQILRRIVEFAVQCIGQWEITVPSVSFNGRHQSAGSNPVTSYEEETNNDNTFTYY